MLLALLIPLVLAPAASAGTETATAGDVSATLTWKETGRRGFHDLRLTIARGGVTFLSQAVSPRCREFCSRPAYLAARQRSLQLRDLDRDGEPEALVPLFSGGAHCCTSLVIYGFDAGASVYRRESFDWGNFGFRLRDVGGDGLVEQVGTDDKFVYLYTSYVEAAAPIRILRYRRLRLEDVTRRFPVLIRRDRARQWRRLRELRRHRADPRGAAAAWQADNTLLGRAATRRGWRTLQAMAARGALDRPRHATGPSAFAYVEDLRKQLRKLQYLR